MRKLAIWGHYMAGGTGTMFFFTDPIGDLNMEDYRSRDHLFELIHYAQDFVARYLPVQDMRHADELTPATNDYVLTKPGQIYAVYLPDGGTTTLDSAQATGNFEVKWYNPRTGGERRTAACAPSAGAAAGRWARRRPAVRATGPC